MASKVQNQNLPVVFHDLAPGTCRLCLRLLASTTYSERYLKADLEVLPGQETVMDLPKPKA